MDVVVNCSSTIYSADSYSDTEVDEPSVIRIQDPFETGDATAFCELVQRCFY